MASINIRNGSYRVRITPKTHKPISKSFKTESEANKWIRQIEMQLELGIYQENNKKSRTNPDIFISEAVDLYISSKSIHKKNCKSETGILRILEKRWKSKKLVSITKQDVLAVKTDLISTGRAASTINHYINAISKLFQMFINELEVKVSNPVIGIKRMPEPQGRIKRLLPEAESILLSQIPQKSQVPLNSIIVIAIETGMRAGEILGLKWEDVDLSNRKAVLRYTKNGDSRVVPLSIRARDELANLILNRETDLVFPYCGWKVRRQFTKTVQNAKNKFEGIQNPFIDLRFHDLRHEALSRLSDKGLNVIELAHISGHRTLSMLRRYTHPCHEALLDKMDKNTHKSNCGN